MFTGIIEELGIVKYITDGSIYVICSKVLQNTNLGDSIAVNGTCLTVSKIDKTGFAADISLETKKVTVFKNIKQNDIVNLERAMAANGRFGGHIVSGHIDGRGKYKSLTKLGDFYNIEAELPYELSKYVIKKGSIAINGISLTVADMKDNIVKIAVIPHTYENTNLKYLKAGDYVNIEVDMFAKYIEKFLSTGDNKTEIDENFLQDNGYL